MDKKKLIIVIAAVVAVLLVAAILVIANLGKDAKQPGNPAVENTEGTAEPLNEEPVIGVEETNPDFTGPNFEIDFDDLIASASN